MCQTLRTGVELSQNMKITESTKESRVEIYSCSFCKFIQQGIGVENLEPVDEIKYVFHLKHAHGVER